MSNNQNQDHDSRKPGAQPAAPDKGHDPKKPADAGHAGQQHARSDQGSHQQGSNPSPGQQHGGGQGQSSGQQHAADVKHGQHDSPAKGSNHERQEADNRSAAREDHGKDAGKKSG